MYAYLIVEIDKAKLFVDNSKVTPDVMEHLKSAGIELKPYDAILSEVKRCAWNLLLFFFFFLWESKFFRLMIHSFTFLMEKMSFLFLSSF